MSNTISGKTGITGASSLISGAAVAPVVVWVLGLFGVEIPPDVAAVIGGLLASGVATLVAYVVPAKSGRYVDTEPWEAEITEDPATDSFTPDPEVDTDWDAERDGSMSDFADTEPQKVS